MMQSVVDNFHFLRPEWFLALVPVVLLFVILKTREARGSRWEDTIDPKLLPFLLDRSNARASRSPLSLLLIAWIVAVVALAGPVWEKRPRPVQAREDALIVILDLTRSMYATDEKPDRLTRAKRKLLDLLESRDEGVTGLVVFAGDAHGVVPLTDDTDTIAAMVPALGPEIMPASGSRLAPAIRIAERLFQDAGVTSGHILVITDEIRDRAAALEAAREIGRAFAISVLAVGTPQGAPVPLAAFGKDRGYLKTDSGVLVIPKVDVDSLRSFAQAAGGRFSRMTLTDEDLDYLLSDRPLPGSDAFRVVERDFDVWIEQGPWLVLLLLPLAALAFRRGWLWTLAIAVMVHSEPADALSWEDLWLTPDQQGMKALERGDPEQAAASFEDPAWQATALYRAEDYAGAAKQFDRLPGGDAKYNQGNALARQGRYKEAIEAYEQALALNPDDEDAAFNKKLVEDLLKKRQQQQRQDDGRRDGNRDSDQQPEQSGQRSREGQQGEQDSRRRQQQQADEDRREDQQGRQAAREQREDRQQAAQDEKEDREDRQQTARAEADRLEDEERQALEQWLRRVPDDPGGLLRRKFLKQYEDRLKRGEVDRDDARDW